MPDWFLRQRLRCPRGEENSSRENGKAVSLRIPGHDLFFRSTGPERRHDPAGNPCKPDERQQFGRPSGDPPTPDESEKLARIIKHISDPVIGAKKVSNGLPQRGLNRPGRVAEFT